MAIGRAGEQGWPFNFHMIVRDRMKSLGGASLICICIYFAEFCFPVICLFKRIVCTDFSLVLKVSLCISFFCLLAIKKHSVFEETTRRVYLCREDL